MGLNAEGIHGLNDEMARSKISAIIKKENRNTLVIDLVDLIMYAKTAMCN